MTTPRRFPVGRVIVLIAVLVAFAVITQKSPSTNLRTVAPGLEFGTVRGDPYCQRGSSDIAVLRLDPHVVDVRVHHYALEAGRIPPTITEWLARTGALAVFNAGQYYPDYSYMGLLVSGGETVSSRLHPQFQAALVATIRDGHTVAQVLDLKDQPLDPRSSSWREVAQSFMLFDRHGEIRVRESNQIAKRTIVGEDGAGRLVVLTTEGAYTLYDLAGLAQSLPLGLSHAMSMDGGDEAELVVRSGEFSYASFGPWEDEGDELHATGARVPLPTVVSVGAR